jgi:hypothetical protein
MSDIGVFLLAEILNVRQMNSFDSVCVPVVYLRNKSDFRRGGPLLDFAEQIHRA